MNVPVHSAIDSQIQALDPNKWDKINPTSLA